ncbi:hypothetical protein [Thermomonas carbonis]|uniref:Uncharacterized protein n=1 Tax=Thermomonas carbonis TaxID=1463158 RepID=A0A7G9SQH9_9GAMM|nr:hypothetical protein [Thermomonas carbonis]QNN70104.1 hypothetical protein H9L16_00120 [Thermomonas carbonis]GHB97788.1 hypothetical protein GCM10010080_07490 [Thermomonas carbonis]
MGAGGGRCLLALMTLAMTDTTSAQPAENTESLAIRSMNICLASAAGGDLHRLATAQAYQAYLHTYSRRIGDRWTFFRAFPIQVDQKGEQGYSCRMTVMRPRPQGSDPVTFSQPGPVFGDVEHVMERLTSGPLAFGNPFRVTYLREVHPDRPGHRRTQLQRLTGNIIEILYLEESHFAFEMFYARGPRGKIGRAEMIDAATDPAINASIHQQITWEARTDYCARRNGGCPPAQREKRTAARSSSSSGGVFLQGSGPGARALSSLEQDYYAGKGYVTVPRQ